MTTASAPAPRRPNVVVIVLDDLGFAQLGCFGSDVGTPNLDRLAAGGLRYNRFHVTPICSPTRACVLTGRNSHAVGMGFLPETPTDRPGYAGRLPRTAATVATLLRDAGYSTLGLGKWHLTPRDDRTAAGPFDQWPLGQGFERFYGFHYGETNQWTPGLIEDNHYVDQPRRPEDGYHLTEDLADTAIRLLLAQQQAAPDRPFLLYFAPGAMHAPHQAPTAWVDRYAGSFDDGWDRWREQTFARQLDSGVVPPGTVLTPRPPWVQAWDGLPPEQQRLYARTQEVFAGFLSHTDHHIGRVIDLLVELGILDDTLVMVLSDNGASAEGGPNGSVNEKRFVADRESLADNLAGVEGWGGFEQYNHYAWGWAWAGNTPFRLWKRYTWLGGTRTPLIVHWPAGIDARGEIREQFSHAIDLMPTLLDACGVATPDTVAGIAQQRVDGASLLATFADADAPAPRSLQHFEMLGSRAIYRDGWKATTDRIVAGVPAELRLMEGSRDLRTDRWSLFDLDSDFSEATDVADEYPELLTELQQLWWAEAGRNQVLPMGIWLQPHRQPSGARVFRPAGGPVADEAVPSLAGGGSVSVVVDIPATGAQGVLCAHGDWTSGWALYVLDGRLRCAVNALGHDHHLVTDGPLPAGRHTVMFDYTAGRGAPERLTLLVDGAEVAGETFASGDLTGFSRTYGISLRLGHDAGFPVCHHYTPPFPWTGTVHRVVYAVGPAAAESLAQLLRHE